MSDCCSKIGFQLFIFFVCVENIAFDGKQVEVHLFQIRLVEKVTNKIETV